MKVKSIFFIFFIWPASTFAGTSSVLQMGGSARSAALQGAVTAAAGDLDGLVYNPAGLSGLTRRQLSTTYSDLLLGGRLNVVKYGHPLSHGSIGFGVTHLANTNIEGRDEFGRPTGNFSAEAFVGTIGFARKIQSNCGIGINLKYIESRISSKKAASGAMDAGFVFRVPGQSLWLGASVTNLGPGLRYDVETTPLPLTYALGVAVEPLPSLRIVADLKHEPRSHQSDISTGIELAVVPQVAIRSGFVTGVNGSGAPHFTFANLQGGMGLMLSRFRIDYALSPFDELGVTHRLSISVPF